MNREDILTELTTDCDILNDIVESYFASCLEKPKVGVYSFRDVEHRFNYSVKEYSIVHSRKIEPVQNPSTDELLKLNDIDNMSLELFKENVNNILRSYTDESWNIDYKKGVLANQIYDFARSNTDMNAPQHKMYQSLKRDKDRYLESIITILQEEEINQVLSEKYIIIEELIKTYTLYTKYFDTGDFREKKKYLMKLPIDSRLELLKKYVEQYLDEYIKEDAIKMIRWFFFYLMYGQHKADIYFIHSMLGFKYNGAVRLYTKLFCKDHSTGRNNDFLHHTDFMNITLNETDENDNLYQQVLHYL